MRGSSGRHAAIDQQLRRHPALAMVSKGRACSDLPGVKKGGFCRDGFLHVPVGVDVVLAAVDHTCQTTQARNVYLSLDPPIHRLPMRTTAEAASKLISLSYPATSCCELESAPEMQARLRRLQCSWHDKACIVLDAAAMLHWVGKGSPMWPRRRGTTSFRRMEVASVPRSMMSSLVSTPACTAAL